MKRVTSSNFILVVAIVSGAISGCSGSSSTTKPPGTTNNVMAISVNTGPAVSVGVVGINSAFGSVTICTPGSTTQCQTIDGLLVDTGSEGIRVLGSLLTISLPQQKDSSGNPIVECTQFVSSEIWGPVQMADVTLGSEKASSIPIQVIGTTVGSTTFPAAPSSCSSGGPVTDDLKSLGANGIIGVGAFIQDCGGGCALTGSSNPGFYYTCPSSGCSVIAEAAAQQVSNPVASFAKDNNGEIVELPAATAPEPSLSGSLIFGIGTQSNNGLGSATVYTLDPNTGDFTTTFRSSTGNGFVDTGSNALYFGTTTSTGMPTCASPLTFWYCPSSTQSFSAQNKGTNGATTTINFSIANADTITANPNNGVGPDLGGPGSGTVSSDFDWGLPFFYGRNVFFAIEGTTAPNGTSPYIAY